MAQFALSTVPGQAQPTIDFSAENQDNPGENGQKISKSNVQVTRTRTRETKTGTIKCRII